MRSPVRIIYAIYIYAIYAPPHSARPYRACPGEAMRLAGGTIGLRVAIFCLTLFVTPIPVAGASSPAACQWPGAAQAVGVAGFRADGVIELQDGRLVRQPDIHYPGTLSSKAAQAQIRALIGTGPAQLYLAGGRQDRWRRFSGALSFYGDDARSGNAGTADGLWLARAIVAAGFAIVAPEAGASATRCVSDLLVAEEAARRAQRGVWRSYDVAPARMPMREIQIGEYGIFKGQVVSARAGRVNVFLNFSDDWSTGLTAIIGPKMQDVFAEAGVRLLDFAGYEMQVRGFLSLMNGPAVFVEDMAQITPAAHGAPARAAARAGDAGD